MVTRLPRAMVDLSEYTESDNWLIYADPGVGKSVLIGQLIDVLRAKDGMALVASSESGIFVAKRYLLAQGVTRAEIKKRYKVWPVRKWQDFEDMYVWVRDHPSVFQWLAFDTATSLQQRSMRAAMEHAVKRNPEKRDIDLPDKGEHQKMQNSMKRMITDFNELPENCLWLANAMRSEDEEGDDIVTPFIMGKGYNVSVWASAQMHMCAYYQKLGHRRTKNREAVVERRLWFNSPPPYWTKDRYSIYGDYATIAMGYDQKTNLSELLLQIDEDPETRSRAQRRLEEDDDTVDTADTADTAAEPVRKRASARKRFQPTEEE